MYPIKNFSTIETNDSTFKPLAPGGYIVKIIDAEDVADKQYFSIIYDIAEGPEAGRYSDEWGKEHPYAHRLVRSYKESALGMFKSFIRALEESQKVNLQEKCINGTLSANDFKGLVFGAVFGYEEYEDKNAAERGDDPIKQRVTIRTIKPVEAIKAGAFKVPDVKKIKRTEPEPTAFGGFVPLTDEDLPF